MNVTTTKAAPETIDTPLLAIAAFSDDGDRGDSFGDVDRALSGLLKALADEEEFDAKPGSTLLLHTAGRTGFGPRRVLVVGCGGAAELKAKDLRGLTASAVQAANSRRLGGIAAVLPSVDGLDEAEAVRFSAEGALLGGYLYNAWRTKDVKEQSVLSVTLAGVGGRHDEIVARTTAACAGVSLARDLVNGPPQEITPIYLAEVATRLAAELGLEIKVFDKAEIEARGMNLLMAVNAGSDIEPRLIHWTYTPPGADENTPSVALVGKGLTFDAGGYNIKPTGHIEEMKLDMAGGAAVLGAMRAVTAWAPKVIVHGVVPSTENLVSGAAYKPGDIYKALNGKSVEIMNTDAEGRLILADALSYISELGVDRIVDLATLTGACVVALGPNIAGIWSNDDAFGAKVKAAADRAGEDAWVMPLAKKLKSMLKSPTADMKNVGARWGGAITAALFLSEFVGKTTWAHMDIAGPSFAEKADGHITKGGTGYAVLALLELVSGEL